MTLAAAVWLLCVPVCGWLMNSLYARITAAWGYSAIDSGRAPFFVRLLSRYGVVVASLIQNSFLFAAVELILRCHPDRPDKGKSLRGAVRGLGAGTAVAAALWLVLVGTDTMRLGNRLLQPHFSIDLLIALPVTFYSWLTALRYLYTLVYRTAKRLAGQAAGCVFTALMAILNAALHGQTTAAALMNTALLALLGCAVYEKSGGTGWLFGFRFAWDAMDRLLLGFPGSGQALYETYAVNSFWLNGGLNGPMSGAAVTAVVCVLLALVLRPRTNRKSSS